MPQSTIKNSLNEILPHPSKERSLIQLMIHQSPLCQGWRPVWHLSLIGWVRVQLHAFGNRFLSHVYQQQLFLCPFSPFADVRIDISQFNWICGLLRYLNPSSIKSTAKAMLVVPATNCDILLLFATRI